MGHARRSQQACAAVTSPSRPAHPHDGSADQAVRLQQVVHASTHQSPRASPSRPLRNRGGRSLAAWLGSTRMRLSTLRQEAGVGAPGCHHHGCHMQHRLTGHASC